MAMKEEEKKRVNEIQRKVLAPTMDTYVMQGYVTQACCCAAHISMLTSAFPNSVNVAMRAPRRLHAMQTNNATSLMKFSLAEFSSIDSVILSLFQVSPLLHLPGVV